jgi:hypothetical protein
MKVHYLETVASDVDAVCAAYGCTRHQVRFSGAASWGSPNGSAAGWGQHWRARSLAGPRSRSISREM